MRLVLWFVSAGLCWAGAAAANTLSGRVTDTAGSGVHPVDIDVYLSSNNTLVNTPDDTTNAQGFYSIQLAAAQYNVVFKPAAGSHLFKKTVNFVNVNVNATLNVTLPRGHYSFRLTANEFGLIQCHAGQVVGATRFPVGYPAPASAMLEPASR